MSAFEFNPKAKAFDLTNALRLAEASRLAYSPDKKVKGFIENEWGFDKYRFFDEKDTQAFMVANDDVAILAFRGTESIKDWLTDADVKFVKGPFGKVHKGFSSAFNNVVGQIKKTIAEFHCDTQSFWITGHSLGGALAGLATAYFVERGVKINGLYTFGLPRIGDSDFAKGFEPKFKRYYFRFINNEDIVTRVPPRAFGYADAGNVLYFDSFGVLHRGIKWWQEFLDLSVSMAVRSLDRFKTLQKQFPNGLEDHNIDRYIENITRNLPR